MGRTMRKVFMGVRLRRLREDRKLTQIALARLLGLSASYLNQLENNQRPLTMAVVLRVSEVFDIDVQSFSDDEEARMVAALRELTAALPPSSVGDTHDTRISQAEIREIAASMPAVGRALIHQHRRHREAMDRLEALAEMGRGDALPAEEQHTLKLQPYEEVRDFFFTHHDHFIELDVLAEQSHAAWGLTHASIADQVEILKRKLNVDFGITVTALPETSSRRRIYDPDRKQLGLSGQITHGQHAFQLAVQLALLTFRPLLDRIADSPRFTGEAVHKLVRVGLANHFAAALILPHGPFLAAAESLRYDIDLLGQHFGVGFETVCHRLSTMRRQATGGVPFFFLRVDRAGNISKRQSAAHFHFSRVGGTCPLWNVYEAFSQPGRIVRQLARMPDGRVYLWIARTVTHHWGGFAGAEKNFAIALGCDLEHAHRLVYAQGLDLSDPDVPTPIGMGCRVCERTRCAQRAFPYIGRSLTVNEHVSGWDGAL